MTLIRSFGLLLGGLLLCSYSGYKIDEVCLKTNLKAKIKLLTEVTKEVRADGQGVNVQKSVYNYDLKGNITELTDTTWSGVDENTILDVSRCRFPRKTVFSYRNDLLVRSRTQSGLEEMKFSINDYQYEFDEKGRVISELCYEAKENLVYQIDDDIEYRRLTKTIYDDKLHTVLEITSSTDFAGTFDEHGRTLKVFDAEGKLIKELDISKSQDVNNKGELQNVTDTFTTLYFYGSSGTLVESKGVTNAGREVGNYKYDEEGRLVRTFNTRLDKTTVEHTYTYSDIDSHGNYLRKTSTSGWVTTRRIEYYE